MQAEITNKFELLARLNRQLEVLAKLRAGALAALVLGALLLLFAGSAHPAQLLVPWLAGGLLGGLALPPLLTSHVLILLKRDLRHGLVRYLFRRGYRVHYTEFGRDRPFRAHRGEPHVPSAR